MADDVTLVVGGRRYGGWKSVRVTRSIESLAGSFALEVSDRWDGATAPWPIAEQNACRVEIDGEVVIDGYVKTRDLSGDASTRTLSYTGKDRAAEIVECSLLVQGAGEKGNKWTYRNLDIAQFAAEITKSHGIKVTVQPGLVLKKDPILVAHPGETGWDALRRVVGSSGVLVVSDGSGGILITRSGNTRATALIEGINILHAAAKYDGTDRYHRYVISSQVPGTDDASGEATRIQAEAVDEAVQPTSRVLLIRPDKGYNAADAKRRADWEARTRAARAETVTIAVQGWRQPSGALWPINAISRVKSPRMVGVDGDMLISQVEFSIGEGGRVTQLNLVRPDAFEPEPQATVKASGGAWKELEKGAF
jgi:prophage tail gpP-like protein